MTAPQPLVFDMNHQVLGMDGRPDNITITVQNMAVPGVPGGDLQISVDDPLVPQYSGMYFNAPANQYTGLTIIGGPENDTIQVAANGVPLGLANIPDTPAPGPLNIQLGTVQPGHHRRHERRQPQ